MFRITLTCVSLALLAGCTNGSKFNPPFEKKSAGVAKSPDQADYFELKKDGTTYILGSTASREAFNNGNPPQLKLATFDNGKTAMIENSSYNGYNRLVTEYKKAKGL